MSGLKTMRFELSGDLAVEVQADRPEGEVRIEFTGFDDNAVVVNAHGWLKPRQAREFAAAILQAADEADPRDDLLKAAKYALWQARHHPDDGGTHAVVRKALADLENHE